MRKFIFIIVFLNFYLNVNSQIHNKAPFCLYDEIHYNADFNYRGIDSINWMPKGRIMMDSVFNTIKGDYTIYRFMSYTNGWLLTDLYCELNDVVVLKVDSNNNIVEGFYYYLQYPEMPSSCYLYHSNRKLKLKGKISMKELQFEQYRKEEFAEYNCNHLSEKLKDNRILNFEKFLGKLQNGRWFLGDVH